MRRVLTRPDAVSTGKTLGTEWAAKITAAAPTDRAALFGEFNKLIRLRAERRAALVAETATESDWLFKIGPDVFLDVADEEARRLATEAFGR
jgi:hypothetical protein